MHVRACVVMARFLKSKVNTLPYNSVSLVSYIDSDFSRCWIPYVSVVGELLIYLVIMSVMDRSF